MWCTILKSHCPSPMILSPKAKTYLKFYMAIISETQSSKKKNSHKCIQIIVSTIVAVNSHMYTLWYKSVWLKWFKRHPKSISMAQCKTAVTPLLTHWSYCSLALSHPYMQQAILFETPQWGSISLTLLLSSPTIKPIKSLTHQDWHAYRSQ